MQQMICGNTQAEIERDTQTSYEEQAQYEWEARRWKLVYNWLLQGKNVHANVRIYNLAERLSNEYQEFSDFVNCDFDFMHFYRNGELEKSLANLIEQEARTLASVIVGADYE